MPAKKKALNTPLQLLQELSNSLLVHFDKACRQAVAEAESALAKLEKQRGKAQDKLLKARARLDEAGSAGKPKAQAKARNRIEELESSMALLQERQGEMLTYLAELKRDVATATGLARGIQEVETAVGRAMQPAAAKADKAASPKATTTAAKRPAASAKAAASKPTSSARAPAKPAAAKRAPGKAAASSAANSKAASASTA
ncbi:AlgP family protein, partial [Stutzerimonas balearica]|uniref:AlgP family protein n=1 Tax=Stutzerimonas balearica TaxID=74829 RepID=UPI0028A6186D